MRQLHFEAKILGRSARELDLETQCEHIPREISISRECVRTLHARAPFRGQHVKTLHAKATIKKEHPHKKSALRLFGALRV